jgi:hypothetical protein
MQTDDIHDYESGIGYSYGYGDGGCDESGNGFGSKIDDCSTYGCSSYDDDDCGIGYEDGSGYGSD